MPEFGGAGSIGVVMMHADHSEQFEKEGIKITLIHSGSHKVDGSPYAALPKHLQQRWQIEVDQLRDRLAAEIGIGRGARFSKAAALRTEAKDFRSADAMRLGLVDAIADARESFDAFVEGVTEIGATYEQSRLIA